MNVYLHRSVEVRVVPPQNLTKLFILVFICQPFGRVPVSFISGGPYGPRGVLSDFEGGVGVPKVYNRTDPVIVSLVYTGQYFEAAAH